MKITYNWLKEFVDIKVPAKELADKLTMAGLEVVSFEEKSGDFVFEIEITPNRPDWLSVLGVAREVAAVTGSKLKTQESKFKSKISKGKIKIGIEDKKDCPLYTARIIKNVKVGASPEWLRKRLELIGCRSVNNVVDITNYVLFELGEPLHAFDLDKLSGEEIIVRRAKAGEKMLTIDETERDLSANVLVIADSHKAAAIAGVMGGKNTEVGLATRNILLEAAVFDPVVVRRGRQSLGLQSEASYRFERGVDMEMVERASLRAARLIEEFCGSEETLVSSSSMPKPKDIQVDLDTTYLSKVLGVSIALPKIKTILSNLGFKVKQKSKNIIQAKVPSFRKDVKEQVDLIEEVARVFGYERIPSTMPSVKPDVTVRERRDLVSAVKNILVGLGLTEVITYSLTDKPILDSLGIKLANPVEILNPLSQDQEILRPTLLAGLGRAVAFNINQKQDFVAVFEIANVYLAEEEPKEELTLGIAISGTNFFLLEQGLVRDEASPLNLKGIIETVFSRLGIRDYEFSKNIGKGIDVRVRNDRVGIMMCLSPQILEKLNVKNRSIFALEASLDKILDCARLEKKFAPLPKYPGITRDISFILKEELSVKEILAALAQKGAPLLSDIRVSDYYKGKQIPAGYRGLTLSCLYSSNERTLTEKEIQPIHDLLCETLTLQLGAKMR
jgi:phenylalanyl-tRNA synthetase beta chain